MADEVVLQEVMELILAKDHPIVLSFVLHLPKPHGI
jgi:hypothetical protein